MSTIVTHYESLQESAVAGTPLWGIFLASVQQPIRPLLSKVAAIWFSCSFFEECRAPLQKGCPKHQGHKGDPGVTPGTCGAGDEKAQVILVWVRTPGVGNASHPRRLGVMRVRP
jgi:hypothetical protein